MKEIDFIEVVSLARVRSIEILRKKGSEYTTSDGDRLGQFFEAGNLSDTNAARALVGMMAKHYSSIVDMAKHPTSYNLKTWREKLDDLRNYTLLLEGVLIDMGVKDE